MAKIINTPESFMANGSYEVIHYIDNGIGEMGNPFWVNPDYIAYEIMKDKLDDLENYFEFIFNEEGLHIVPKNIDLIKIESDGDQKRIVISFPENKHKEVNIYVGETIITDVDEVCETPPKPPTVGEKIKDVIFGKENDK